jgi:hypothetical protein
MPDMKYESVPQMSQAELADALESNDPERIRSALYSASWYEEDWRWTQNYCLRYLQHDDPQVRWAAALSLGYIAQFHRHLDLDLVLPALRRAQGDPLICLTVGDSFDMIAHNLGMDRAELEQAQ